ncbi:MAG: response regulator transcription factor [Dolichospermum sp.]|jgi:DNA-binding NarL/FixJ family response regulator|nr:helix-turn-helix transcriptional regulator [Microcystis sp. M065S1]MCA6462122.1 helix-turn-helix transcriptional regulator [Chitinophagaceae bacterium]MCA6470159.1 helix-turn-helix transcriptional regulator [Chitinophagaceae bacterium]MCA6478831.1 helix-turn-helix transcriptional regulator [Chitinophagaceae bacterium]MCA6479240.1 helix-turn-helix transcriptional regulator [Chitinophagaceae bacterium]
MLSSREKEVFALLAKGLTYQTIATELLISHETVKKHVKHIYRKLNVKSKIQALIKMNSL